MAISYYDFINLSSPSQQKLVVSEGLVINEDSRDGLKFVLYEMTSFSVEIVYNTVTNKIVGLSTFQNKGIYEK